MLVKSPESWGSKFTLKAEMMSEPNPVFSFVYSKRPCWGVQVWLPRPADISISPDAAHLWTGRPHRTTSNEEFSCCAVPCWKDTVFSTAWSILHFFHRSLLDSKHCSVSLTPHTDRGLLFAVLTSVVHSLCGKRIQWDVWACVVLAWSVNQLKIQTCQHWHATPH